MSIVAATAATRNVRRFLRDVRFRVAVQAKARDGRRPQRSGRGVPLQQHGPVVVGPAPLVAPAVLAD